MTFEVPDGDVARPEVRFVHYGEVERLSRTHTLDLELAEGSTHPENRLVTICSVHDQLAEEWVVMQSHVEVLDDPSVPAHSRAARHLERGDPPARRQETMERILTADPAFQ
jgi:hypothetical protein